jgi:hypothetical protein
MHKKSFCYQHLLFMASPVVSLTSSAPILSNKKPAKKFLAGFSMRIK